MAVDMQRLLALREANLPVATCESLGLKIEPGDTTAPSSADTDPEKVQAITEETRNRIDEYLKDFAAPAPPEDGEEGNIIFGGLRCIFCGRVLTGLLGTFKYTIFHGEGYCDECKYPARSHHYFKDLLNGPIQYILQYHPDKVRAPEEIDDDVEDEEIDDEWQEET